MKNLYLHLDCKYSENLLTKVLNQEGHLNNNYKLFTIQDIKNELNIENEEQITEDILKQFIQSHHIDIQWDEYENVIWDMVLKPPLINNEINNEEQVNNKQQQLACNYYCIRKGLIRKAQFAAVMNKYISKKGDKTILFKAIPETYLYELDDPEYFEESLYDIYDVVQSLENNQKLLEENNNLQLTTWILKPSITNKGAEIFIFNSLEQLQNYFTKKHEQALEAIKKQEEQEENGENQELSENNNDPYDDLRQLREWVIQRYVDRPLLLCGNRKFHMRVYVLAVSNLKVYVYDQILALFALKPFKQGLLEDKFSHITNTCIQVNEKEFIESESVKLFWKLHQEDTIKLNDLINIFEQVKAITGETFLACSSELSFMPLNHCFELYGLDFLVDQDLNVSLLEVNAGPDFKQTGNDLDSVIYGLFRETCDIALENNESKVFNNNGNSETELDSYYNNEERGRMHLVLDKKGMC
ncbi:hypothetical protein ABK040_005529 [Willaertia magna]